MANQIGEHRGAGVAETAQSAGGADLNAIGDLKECHQRKDFNPEFNHSGIMRESTEQRAWKDQVTERENAHDRDRCSDAKPVGDIGVPWLPRPYESPNPNRGGSGKAQGNHESE